MAARKLVVGNWKMNGLRADLHEVRSLANALSREPPACRVAIAPPATLIHPLAEIAGEVMEVAAQDLHPEPCGPRTGDLGAEMLHDAGARLVILGHSERRSDHREDDALVAAKVEAALRAGLEPIVCVGETAEERRGGRALGVVRRQLAGSLPPALNGRRFAVAYEPVWAIGTGATPTLRQIAAVHGAIRDSIGRSSEIPILYGGSVRAANAVELLRTPGVDGALVGGASLKCSDFLPIVRAAG